MTKSAFESGAIAVAAIIAIIVEAAIGPVSAAPSAKVFLESTIAINIAEEGGEITLPLFEGSFGGIDVFYIITESSDRDDARAQGVNWAPKLANALDTAAVQSVTMSGGVVEFAGTVNFTPTRVVVPGETGFPPAVAMPGSVGDANYSPLIEIDGNGIVLNAPHVARSDQPVNFHDRVLTIDFDDMTVTLDLTSGFYHGKDIFYISTEASVPDVAALEAATFAPNLNAAPGLGSNDETSARASIVPIVNGQTGAGNPNRQGLQSALLGQGDPLNITVEHPNNRGQTPLYSPLWDVHPAVWTAAAIAAGQRVLLDHHDDIADAVEEGLLISAGAGPSNPLLGGLQAAGFIVNCPIMALR